MSTECIFCFKSWSVDLLHLYLFLFLFSLHLAVSALLIFSLRERFDLLLCEHHICGAFSV